MSGRDMGSAKHGSGHWWRQRVSAIALVPLTLWFVFSVAAYTGAPHGAAAAFLSNPVNAVLMLLFAVVGLSHAVLGLQVVIEDYIDRHATRMSLMLLIRFAAVLIAAACAVAVLRLAL